MAERRVAVTGLGIISPAGTGKEEYWQSLITGKSGVGKVTSFDTSAFKHHCGAEVRDFKPTDYIDNRLLPFLGRTSQLAISAAKLAFKDSGIDTSEIPNLKSGVIMGTTMGERSLEEALTTWIKGGTGKINKNLVLQAMMNSIPLNIGNYFRIPNTNLLIPTACAAGNYAIGYGFDLIKDGQLDIAVTGGADSFSLIAFSGFQRLYAMAPEKCQPFDKNRKGMILGEGAGVLILEEIKSAKKRKAHIYAEVLGYGLSCDARHITAPSRHGIKKAMGKALKNSGISPKDVDYISTHGTGTIQNDKEEAIAIKELFGRETPSSSIKSMQGHCMGAASALEAISCCLAIQEGGLPPTINFETPDPECTIDCVPNFARKAQVRIALNNSFAFGGNNCCTVFRK